MSCENYLPFPCLISPIFKGSNKQDNDLCQRVLVIICLKQRPCILIYTGKNNLSDRHGGIICYLFWKFDFTGKREYQRGCLLTHSRAMLTRSGRASATGGVSCSLNSNSDLISTAIISILSGSFSPNCLPNSRADLSVES